MNSYPLLAHALLLRAETFGAAIPRLRRLHRVFAGSRKERRSHDQSDLCVPGGSGGGGRSRALCGWRRGQPPAATVSRARSARRPPKHREQRVLASRQLEGKQLKKEGDRRGGVDPNDPNRSADDRAGGASCEREGGRDDGGGIVLELGASTTLVPHRSHLGARGCGGGACFSSAKPNGRPVGKAAQLKSSR